MKKIILATALVATMMVPSVFANNDDSNVLLDFMGGGTTVTLDTDQSNERNYVAGPSHKKTIDPATVLKALGIKKVKSSQLPGGGKVASFEAAKTKVQVYCMMTSEVNMTCMAPA